jgi:hypothetical protein
MFINFANSKANIAEDHPFELAILKHVDIFLKLVLKVNLSHRVHRISLTVIVNVHQFPKTKNVHRLVIIIYSLL